MTRRSSSRRIADQHISYLDDREWVPNRPRTVYKRVYECDHCGKEFSVERGVIRSSMDDEVVNHLRNEHPEELEREPYPNEGVFREWAAAIDRKVEEPVVPGDALVIRYTDLAYVYLENDGTIHHEANRVLGGSEDTHEVRLEGEDRLVVDDGRKRQYISDSAFPVMRR